MKNEKRLKERNEIQFDVNPTLFKNIMKVKAVQAQTTHMYVVCNITFFILSRFGA